MLTGKELGDALRSAMKAKGVTQGQVAQEFGIKQPSVAEWLKHGRIHKKHLTHLVEFFSDKVSPEHWGMPSEWKLSVSEPDPVAGGPPPKPDFTSRSVSDSEWATLQELRVLPDEDRDELVNEIHARGAKFIRYMKQMRQREEGAPSQPIREALLTPEELVSRTLKGKP